MSLTIEELRSINSRARALLDQHGLSDWIFLWSSAKRRYGVCRYRAKEIAISIELARLNPIEKTIDTILHEIAHALTPKTGHGPAWKKKCLEIGALPNRCYDTEKVITPRHQWTGRCPSCGTEVSRHKRRKIACRRCCMKLNRGKFSEAFLFIWRAS